jgi:hypothetical protein
MMTNTRISSRNCFSPNVCMLCADSIIQACNKSNSWQLSFQSNVWLQKLIPQHELCAEIHEKLLLEVYDRSLRRG